MIYITPLTDEARKLIERVYRVYPDDRQLSYWEEQMRLGSAFTFVQIDSDEMVYAGIVQVCEDGLNAIVGGGIDGRIDVNEMYHFLVSATKHLNKSLIRLTGRLGWFRKYLKNLKFKQVNTFVAKNGRLVGVFERGI